MRTLADWLELQQSVHARSIDLGLGRVAAVARTLGVDKLPCPVITVGGTNGKGSTVAHIDSLLHAAGVRTGAFTSPHLVRYNERIRIAGQEVSDEQLIAAFERIEAARGTTTLTFFEYGTLAALLLFAELRVEAAILEVGLGGRLDATNLIDADVAVLCSVGLDHRDWLGDTLEAIGAEKSGIFRAGRPAVLGSADMPSSVLAAIADIGAQPVIAERDFSWTVRDDHWSYRGLGISLERLPPPALAGAIQYRNASTAIAALEALGIPPTLDDKVIARGLSAVRLPGRFQIVPGPVEWILDVAHNEPAAQVFASQLRARSCAGRTIAVIGMLEDKDATAVGRMLDALVDEWIVCSLSIPRGLSAQELSNRLAVDAAKITMAASVEAGCELAQARTQSPDCVIVFGSFHTVGPALEWLRLY